MEKVSLLIIRVKVVKLWISAATSEQLLFPSVAVRKLFLCSASMTLQEENSDVGEEVVVLEGGPSPAPVRYHTPAFPPEAPSSRRAEIVTPVVGGGRTQDILENRLVEW